MSDPRPRPQYGEYAPEGWVSPVASVAPDEPPAPVPAPTEAKPARTWDRFLTYGLLGLGLYSVISGFFAFTDAPTLFRQVFELLEVGEFTSDEAARSAGIAIMVIQAAIWLVAAVLGARALRNGKLGFVWPLGAGIVANIIVGIIAGVVMAGDPAYIEYLGQLTP